ncbi:DUF2855 family protein [Aspergillus mulundensis]|uniref:Uncharacterized protein n=1 Tax=Aspergillus mulundensis TaxID=1810919 RepID=A0A3D8RSD8_9EURO|nr:Uncharacterized protein DSM5745_06858 [Aspergillus mulundensis]RDW76866.1 Uncharacterized protein DSM5745_06858 [Aspergillus mulundensis]
MSVHVVSKLDNRRHATVQVPPPTNPLRPSSVRVRTSLLGLTSNNLTYAMGGSVLGWWDAYPLPDAWPAPYENQTWGIVPAWGFAVVLETTVPDITPGTTLFGLWPTSSCPVDLELTTADPQLPGHWQEVSPHRQTLASFYNRYTIVDTKDRDLDTLAWDAVVYPTWGAGYILSEYIFPPDSAHPGIHPLGAAGGDWTAEDADLSKAAFISLAASTKTARGAAFNILRRPAGSGPAAFLQITSSPTPLAKAAEASSPNFPVKVLPYTEIAQAAPWLERLEAKPERIVIADFGGRDGTLDVLLETIQSTGLQSAKVTIIAVGNQQKVRLSPHEYLRVHVALTSTIHGQVYTIPEIMAAQASHASMKVQMNTSGVQGAALRLGDPKTYFDELRNRWGQWVERRDIVAPDLRLVWGEGVVGGHGIEGGWDALCRGEVEPDQALVYRM